MFCRGCWKSCLLFYLSQGFHKGSVYLNGLEVQKERQNESAEKRGFTPLGKEWICYTPSTPRKIFLKWILDLPNYLGRDDHWFSAHRCPCRPCCWGSRLDCAMTATAAPGIWSSSERCPGPVGDTAKPTVWPCPYECWLPVLTTSFSQVVNVSASGPTFWYITLLCFTCWSVSSQFSVQLSPTLRFQITKVWTLR